LKEKSNRRFGIQRGADEIAKHLQTKFRKSGKMLCAKPIVVEPASLHTYFSIINEQDINEARAHKREGVVVEDDYAHQESELQAHKTKKTNECENCKG
jgi:hypothetical protein